MQSTHFGWSFICLMNFTSIQSFIYIFFSFCCIYILITNVSLTRHKEMKFVYEMCEHKKDNLMIEIRLFVVYVWSCCIFINFFEYFCLLFLLQNFTIWFRIDMLQLTVFKIRKVFLTKTHKCLLLHNFQSLPSISIVLRT